MKNFGWVLAGAALGALAVIAVAAPARALNVGDAAPDFTANSVVAGKAVKFSLKDALAKHAIVLYFFPKAFTTG